MSTWTELACLLASIFLVSSIGVCLKCFPTSFAESVWRDHLMSSRINPISFLLVSVWWVWSVSVRAGSHRFFLPMSVRRNLLMSVWTELACFLASVFLVSSIGVCLKCFPLLVCQYLSSGPTWFLSEFFLKNLSVSSNLLSSVFEQSCLKGLRTFC